MAPYIHTNPIDSGEIQNLEAQVTTNIRLVINIAIRFQNNGLSLIDLIHKGKTGLTRAFRNYNESKGFDFVDYATWHIRQSMVQAMAEYEPNRPIPLNRIGLRMKSQNAILKPDHCFKREPGIRDMESIKKFRIRSTMDASLVNNRSSKA